MLNWLRGHGKVEPVQSAWVPEMVDRVAHHVEEQVFAFSGRRGVPVPSYSSLADLLIEAYILRALEGYALTAPVAQQANEQEAVRETL